MKLSILTLILLLGVLGACTKTENGCPVQKPILTADSSIIAGDSLHLSVSGVGDVYLYNWYGPAGFISHDSAPAIPGSTSANAGRYTVDVVTNGGCIYSVTSDSIRVTSPVLPCTLANNSCDIRGDETLYFTYITTKVDGGDFYLEGSGYEGDAEFQFQGSGLPAAGVYTITGSYDPGPREVRVSFTDYAGMWNVSGGPVYVSVTNKKITVSACTANLSSSTYGFKTTGSFQLTQP
jgi:hypothetical protein